MKSEILNEVLNIRFPETINSDNSDEVSEETFRCVDSAPGLPITVDLHDTKYISSAGLRVLLKLQKTGRLQKVTGLCPEVYEIFEVTGFSSILTVEKRLRSISLEGAALIGEGFSSRVYRIADDTIVKVFIRDTSLEDIRRELNLAKRAFVLGIPTAISYDVVDVDGRYGVIFELINCGLLRDALLAEPDAFDDYMRRYTDLLLTLNTTDVANTVLPDIKDIYLERLDWLKGRVSDADRAEMEEFIRSIPDAHTFVHGDCHIKNIMVSGSDLLLIDMDTLSCGNPLFELARLYAPYYLFPQVRENSSERFFGIPLEMAHRIMDSVLKYYFRDTDEEEKTDKIRRMIRLSLIFMLCFYVKNEPDNTAAFEKLYELYRQDR